MESTQSSWDRPIPDPCPACGALPCDWAESPLNAAEDWSPIESAPKSSGDILLYSAKTGEQFVAFWGVNADDYADSDWVFARGDGISFIVGNPTHWCPLRSPPK